MTADVYFVDVFTHDRSGGNPLAVAIHDGDLTDRDMRDQAGELDCAETAFVTRVPGRSGLRALRVFTSQRETPFSGTAALGAASVIREYLESGVPGEAHLEMPFGDVHVRFEAGEGGGIAWLTAPTIELGSAWPAQEVYAVLGMHGVSPAGLPPPQLTGAGLPVLIVPVPGLSQLQACMLDGPAFKAFAVKMVRHKALNAVVYAFCTETRDSHHHIAARLLLAGEEELEDPASGSAAACLGAYLLTQGRLDAPHEDLLIEQGYEMGRPSLLRLRSKRIAAGVIEVGGTVRPVATDES